MLSYSIILFLSRIITVFKKIIPNVFSYLFLYHIWVSATCAIYRIRALFMFSIKKLLELGYLLYVYIYILNASSLFFRIDVLLHFEGWDRERGKFWLPRKGCWRTTVFCIHNYYWLVLMKYKHLKFKKKINLKKKHLCCFVCFFSQKILLTFGN